MKLSQYVMQLALVAGLATGCQSCSDETGAAEMRAVLEKNIEGWTNEDLPQILSSFTADSEKRDAAKRTSQAVFPATDLELSIESFEYLSGDDKEAKVKVTQFSKRVGGGPFKDSRMVITYTFQNTGLGWRIHTYVVDSLKYRDEK